MEARQHNTQHISDQGTNEADYMSDTDMSRLADNKLNDKFYHRGIEK